MENVSLRILETNQAKKMQTELIKIDESLNSINCVFRKSKPNSRRVNFESVKVKVRHLGTQLTPADQKKTVKPKGIYMLEKSSDKLPALKLPSKTITSPNPLIESFGGPPQIQLNASHSKHGMQLSELELAKQLMKVILDKQMVAEKLWKPKENINL